MRMSESDFLFRCYSEPTMTRRHQVALGDSYVVVALMDKPGYPPHARLQEAEGGAPYDEVLVGVLALSDPTAWRRLD